jgi:DNA-binding NarL/FixJ family response regulator
MENSQPNLEPKRIGLVCTDPLRCLGLEVLLREIPEMQFTQFGDIGEIDLARLDIMMLDRECCDDTPRLLRTFRKVRPALKVVVLGPAATLEEIETIIGAGAKGYLAYEAELEEVRTAMQIISDGSVWAPRKVLARLLESAQSRSTPKESTSNEVYVTPREHEVLQLVCQGQTNQGIADILSLDIGTVKAHLSKLMRKMGVDNRTAMVMHALSRRVITRRSGES